MDNTEITPEQRKHYAEFEVRKKKRTLAGIPIVVGFCFGLFVLALMLLKSPLFHQVLQIPITVSLGLFIFAGVIYGHMVWKCPKCNNSHGNSSNPKRCPACNVQLSE